MSVSRTWTSESLPTNFARERPESLVNVLVVMKRRLGSKASVTVHAAPAMVFTAHLAAELVVTGKRNGPRTNHEALLALDWSTCT